MRVPTGRRFVLRTVADFLDLPADCRETCLSEFQGWLAHVDADRVRTAPRSIGPFIWTDDGIGGVTTERRYLERDALIVGPGYLDRNVNDTTRRYRDMRVREQHARQA